MKVGKCARGEWMGRRVNLLLVGTILVSVLVVGIGALPTATATVWTIQPDEEDASVREDLPDDTLAGIYAHTNLSNNRRALIKFNISAIPEQADISNAEMILRCSEGPGFGFEGNIWPVAAKRLLASFNSSVTWNTQPAHTDDDDDTANCFVVGFDSNWEDLTEIVKGWHNGTFINYGLKLRFVTEDNTTPDEGTLLRWKGLADTPPSERPKLAITYTIPGPSPFEPAWLVVSYFNGFGGFGIPFETFQTKMENSTGTHRIPFVPWPVNASETVNITTFDFLGNEINRMDGVSLGAKDNYTLIDISINITEVFLIFSDGRPHLHEFEELASGKLTIAFDAPTNLFADLNYSYRVFEDNQIFEVEETNLTDLISAVQVVEVNVTLKNVEVRYALYDSATGEGIPFWAFKVFANDERLRTPSYFTGTNNSVTTVVDDFFDNELYNQTQTANSNPYYWDIGLTTYSWKLFNQMYEQCILSEFTYNGSAIDKSEFVMPLEVIAYWVRSGDYTLNVTYYSDNYCSSVDQQQTFYFTISAANAFFVTSQHTLKRAIDDIENVTNKINLVWDATNSTWNAVNDTYDSLQNVWSKLNFTSDNVRFTWDTTNNTWLAVNNTDGKVEGVWNRGNQTYDNILFVWDNMNSTWSSVNTTTGKVEGTWSAVNDTYTQVSLTWDSVNNTYVLVDSTNNNTLLVYDQVNNTWITVNDTWTLIADYTTPNIRINLIDPPHPLVHIIPAQAKDFDNDGFIDLDPYVMMEVGMTQEGSGTGIDLLTPRPSGYNLIECISDTLFISGLDGGTYNVSVDDGTTNTTTNSATVTTRIDGSCVKVYVESTATLELTRLVEMRLWDLFTWNLNPDTLRYSVDVNLTNPTDFDWQNLATHVAFPDGIEVDGSSVTVWDILNARYLDKGQFQVDEDSGVQFGFFYLNTSVSREFRIAFFQRESVEQFPPPVIHISVWSQAIEDYLGRNFYVIEVLWANNYAGKYVGPVFISLDFSFNGVKAVHVIDMSTGSPLLSEVIGTKVVQILSMEVERGQTLELKVYFEQRVDEVTANVLFYEIYGIPLGLLLFISALSTTIAGAILIIVRPRTREGEVNLIFLTPGALLFFLWFILLVWQTFT